jgi:hypothetical protein
MSRNDKESQEVEAHRRRILDEKWDGRSNFTVPETAEVLRISVWAAYEGMKRGDIPFFRVNKTLRSPRHALEKKMLGE